MTVLASIAVSTAAMLAPPRIQAKLNALQAGLSRHADPPPQSLVFNHNTIIAGYRWQDEDGPNGLIVAYRLTKDGELKRLADFRYGDNPTALTLDDATGDGVPEVLVRGTQGNVEVLTWDGKHFNLIAETDTTARFIDVDGDGVPEVLTRSCCATNGCGATLGTPFVDKISDGTLVAVDAPDLEDFIDITKTSDEPETIDAMIALRDDASTTCTFHVVHGPHRVTGVTIAGESDIPPDQPVTLASRCTRVRVTVTGPRGSKLSILVTAPRAQ